jgi:hypothetical protein
MRTNSFSVTKSRSSCQAAWRGLGPRLSDPDALRRHRFGSSWGLFQSSLGGLCYRTGDRSPETPRASKLQAIASCGLGVVIDIQPELSVCPKGKRRGVKYQVWTRGRGSETLPNLLSALPRTSHAINPPLLITLLFGAGPRHQVWCRVAINLFVHFRWGRRRVPRAWLAVTFVASFIQIFIYRHGQ